MGPLLGLLVGVMCGWQGYDFAFLVVVSVAIWCALWWIFEPIPIPATALIPFSVFGLTGVLTPKEIAHAYGHPLILLLMAGFMLSKAVEKSGVHRRIALAMLKAFGFAGDRGMVLAFMLTAALLSMWISNTACALMLLPVALGVLEQLKDKSITVPLLLGIAYGASIGGIGTPIGTPPNLIFLQVYQENTQNSIGFLQWMFWTVPLVLILIPVCGLWLTRSVRKKQPYMLPSVGVWSSAEKQVLAVVLITALLWVTRKQPFGGWSQWLGLVHANDASVVIASVVMLFVLRDKQKTPLLDWQTASQIPWGILLLFSGGILLAKGFIVSGVSTVLGEHLSALSVWPLFGLLVAICLGVTFLTEVTSNTATTNLLMPVFASAALAANIEPAMMMLPAAISASCAFMLPVATAPNSIVYSSGQVSIRTMALEGLVLNVVAAVMIALWFYACFTYF